MIVSSRRSLAACIVAIIFLFTSSQVFARIVISELMWAGSDLSLADEWIELVNTSSGSVSLSGWTLTKFTGGSEVPMLTLPPRTSIGSGSFFLIANYDAAHSRLAIDPDIVDTAVSLNNTQLLIRLYDDAGSLIDTADDGTGAPLAGSSGSQKASMERIHPGGSGSLSESWQTASRFINFDDGSPLRGTPGAAHTAGNMEDTFPPLEATQLSAELETEIASHIRISWTPSISLDLSSQSLMWSGTGRILTASASGVILPDIGTGVTFTLQSTDVSGNSSSGITTISRSPPNILITEVLSNPAGADTEEWIEIANFGSSEEDIGGWILDEGNSPAYYLIPNKTSLKPGEHRSFRKSETELSLDNGGEKISLMRSGRMIDEWEYPETAEEVSYGRSTGDHESFRRFCAPTEGKPNILADPEPRIVIQSGTLEDAGKVTVNLIVEILTGSTVHALCRWDYGDGYTPESCNPPSHTISQAGTYQIHLTYSDMCGSSVTRSVTATVHESQGRRSSGGDGGSSSVTEKKSGGSSVSASGNDDRCSPSIFEGIRISEIMPNPVGYDESLFAPPTVKSPAKGEWIELENIEDEPASLCGWSIDDGEKGSTPFSLDSYRIPAKGFLVLPRDETKIALNNSDETVRLFGPESLKEKVDYKKSFEGMSYSRDRLRSIIGSTEGIFSWTSAVTPGFTNRFLSVKDVNAKQSEESEPDDAAAAASNIISWTMPEILPVISEVMSRSPNEYIEIYNPSSQALNLSGWSIDDARDASSKPMRIKDDIVIAPDSYIVLCKGTGCTLRLRVTLNDEGETITLYDPIDSPASEIHYPRMQRGEAYAFDVEKNAWFVTDIPTPGALNIVRAPIANNYPGAQSKKNKKSKQQSKSVTLKRGTNTKNPIDMLPKRYRASLTQMQVPTPPLSSASGLHRLLRDRALEPGKISPHRTASHIPLRAPIALFPFAILLSAKLASPQKTKSVI